MGAQVRQIDAASSALARASAKGLVCALAAGCAPTLSSMTPAHVAPHEHVQMEAGFDVSIPTGVISDAIDAGETLSNTAGQRPLTQAEQADLFRAGASLVLNPPSVVPRIGVAYGLVENLEVGGRLSTGAWRLGARYQFLHQKDHGWDVSAGLGGGRYTFEFPVNDVLSVLELEDFERWQLDGSVLAGHRGNIHRVWLGPRVVMTWYSTALRYRQPDLAGFPPSQTLASFDGNGLYLGGQLGGAVGYKYVFFAFELSVAHFSNSAELAAFGSSRSVDLDGWIVYPAMGLLGEF
jgi:hypothetical protein